jgi:RNA polymerase sigma factor (sigma-70 family)
MTPASELKMDSAGSVSAWIGQLKAGEESALAKLHRRYWPALIGLARKRLGQVALRAADEEDVAQEAFWAFYQTVKSGQLPRLENRHHLLALLSHIIACRAANHINRELGTQKRGSGRVRDEAALQVLFHDSSGRGLDQTPDRHGTPLEEVMLQDCYRRFVTDLPVALRAYAEWYLIGVSHAEIAQRLDCSRRTVARKIALVLRKWQEMAACSLAESTEEGAHDS